MGISIPDTIVFFVLITGNIIFGISFYRKNKTTDQFTAAGRKLPSWIVGMSIFATFVSSISYLALPGKAYMTNWNAFVFSLSIPFAAILTIKFFIPLYRGIGNISAYYYLEQRFGIWARIYASLCYVLTQVMRTGAILMLLALPLNALSPLVFTEGKIIAFKSPFHTNLTIVFGTMTIFLVGFLLTKFVKNKFQHT